MTAEQFDRYLTLAERDAAASQLLTYLAGRHPNTPLAAALAEVASDPLAPPLRREIATGNLAVARRSQDDLIRILDGAAP